MRGKFIGTVALIGLFVWALDVRAAGDVRCDVLTIKATKTKQGGIDKELRSYRAIFGQPPFVAFNTFKLEKRKVYPMKLRSPVALSLPSPLTGSLRLRGEKEGQFMLTLALIRKSGDPIEIEGRASPRTPFFAAGFAIPGGGVWVFGVHCHRAQIVNY